MTQAPGNDRISLDRMSLRAGMRLAVAVSGGADSVGLLRKLHETAPEIGLVVSVAHVHHGIRGAEADEDERFVAKLAEDLGLTLSVNRVEATVVAREKKQTLEEAARELRYAWFRQLLSQGKVDAVATAHTLDDQAETVVHRLLRGAWTEGLSGIHPVVQCSTGVILRPFLNARSEAIRAWLREIGQAWREDATNSDTAHTRNRIRHELLPRLREFNPRIAEQLANMAIIARDEESFWDAELARMLPGLMLPGKPVRGGGRSVSTHPGENSVGMEVERLRALPTALRRRVVRAAAKRFGCALNFEQTERLLRMCREDPEPTEARKQELATGFGAERSPRELRLVVKPADAPNDAAARVEAMIPGEVSGLGVRLRLKIAEGASSEGMSPAFLRTPKAGDRARIRYSRGTKPLKEIFERMQVEAEERKTWPLLEWEGRIVWMKGIDIEPEAEVPFVVGITPE